MEMSSPSGNRVIKRRNKKGSACTHCRQLKFKCDAANRFPAPCSRCANAKDGRHCTIDPSFRRTANKQRLDSLEEELEHMRQEMRRRQTSPSTTSTSIAEVVAREPSTMDLADVPNSRQPFEEPSQDVSPQAISGIELLPHTVIQLIEEFYAHFHSYFPILPEKSVFLSKYNFNKLLLWTVLAIASRESSQHSGIYASLVDPVRRLAGDVYGSQSRSFETVQALLLLCVWPFPFQQTINDPSPMYIALASQIAYQLGLHRPAFRSDFTENNIPQADPGESARKKVWFGCCVVNQFVTAKLGTPSTIRPGNALLAEISHGNLSVMPEPLISQLHLTYISSKAFTALGDHEWLASGGVHECLGMVRAFESELMQIHDKFKHRWGLGMELLYLDQLLHLYSFALDCSNTSTVTSQSDIEIDIIYAKTYDTVLRVCRLAASAPTSSLYWPVFIKYAVFYGVVLACPIANLTDHGSSQRRDLIEAITGGLATMRSWSMFEKDHFSRVGTHMSWLVRKMQAAEQGIITAPVKLMGVSMANNAENGKKRLRCTVKSRMATNIMYETIWTAKLSAKAEELANNHVASAPNPGLNSFTTVPDAQQVMMGGGLDLPSLDAGLDNFVFTDGWENSGFLDIFADWQSLIGTA